MKIILADRYIKIVFPFILFIIFFFSSCNLFFSLPHGRENVDDPNAQITAFTALPSGDDSIVTMWNWKDTPGSWSDEEIDEIHIQHSILGYPENLNLIFGETFSNNTAWQHEWKDLIPGITHYFSLFAKSSDGDGGDIWFAPIKAKITLPGTSETGVNYDRIDSLNIDNTGIAEWLDDPDGVLEIGTSKWAVVFLDIPDNVYITSAKIIMSPLSIAGRTITFAPLDGTLPYDNWEIWNQLSDGSIVNEAAGVTYTVDPPVLGEFEITQVVRAASITSQKAILIKITSGTALSFDNNASAPRILADIIK